jgi:hypothetical protein
VDAAPEGGDHRLHLVVVEDAVDAGLLDVQDLAADGQDRLELRVATALRAATGAVALDDVDLDSRGSVDWQSASLPGSEEDSSSPLRA